MAGTRVGSQYADPMAQYFSGEDPLEAMRRKIHRQALGPLAALHPGLFGGDDDLKYPSLTPDEEAGLWETLGTGGMSLLGHVGQILDKYTGSRALRGLIGGLSGQVDWDRAGSEILSVIPGSDVVGLTDKENTVWSEDITGLKGKGYSGFGPGLDWGDWLNFGLDVVLDPTMAATFGASGALKKAGQSLSKAGKLDPFFDAVRSGSFTKPGLREGMARGEAKMNYTLQDVFDWNKQVEAAYPTRGRQDYADIMTALQSEGLTRPVKSSDLASQADRYASAAEHAAGGPGKKVQKGLWDDAVDPGPTAHVVKEDELLKPLGGAVGVGLPFRRPMTTLGHGPVSQAYARGMGMTKEWLGDLPGIRHARALLDSKLRGALTRIGRRVAKRMGLEGSERTSRQVSNGLMLRDEIWSTDIGRPAEKVQLGLWDDAVDPAVGRQTLPKGVTFGDMMDSDVVGTQKFIEHMTGIRSFFEGVDDLPEWARGFGLEDKLMGFRDLVTESAENARSFGVKLPDLDDVIDYLPRTRHSFGLFDKSNKGLRAFDVKSPHAIARDPILKYHPGGTAVLQRMSVDPKISGILHGLPRGRGGTVRRLSEEQLAELRKYISDNYWDELYGGDYAKHFNPPDRLGKFPDELEYRTLTEEQRRHLIDPVLHWAANLDPKHVRHQLPAFKADPIDDVFKYVEHVEETAMAARTVHELFAEVADFHRGLEPGIDAIPVAEALRIVGLEGEVAIRKFYEVAMGNQLARQKIWGGAAEGMVDPEAIRKYIAEIPDESLKMGVSRSGADMTVKGEPFEPLLVPREFVEEAKRYLKPFSNPTALNPFIRAFDLFTNAFKTGVTTLFPAFHTRNFVSGMFNNYVSGMADPRFKGPRSIFQPLLDAGKLMRGETINGAGEISFIDDAGRILTGLTDEQATRRLIAENHAYDIVRRGGRSQDPTEVMGASAAASGPVGMDEAATTLRDVLPLGIFNRPQKRKMRIFDDEGNLIPENVGKLAKPEGSILGEIGGRIRAPLAVPSLFSVGAGMFAPSRYIPKVKKLAKDAVPDINEKGLSFWEKYEEFMPWNIRGVAGDETKFFAARWGEDTAFAVEGYNRLSPYIAFRRQGYSAAEASRRVKAAQVDYGALTEFERKVMKRIFPFYTFTRHMTPFVIEQLVQKPSGAMAQVLRKGSQLRGTGPESALLPSWVTRGTAIPVGGGQPGQDRYLMSLGLGHEDPLSMVYIGGTPWQTVSNTARQMMSRINPIPRSIIEAGTGKTMFGGSDMRFTRPAWAYAKENMLGGKVETTPLHTLTANLFPFAPSWPSIVGSAATGGLIPTGSPRYHTMERIISDPRKMMELRGKQVPGPASLIDIMTGFKVGDVDIARSRNLALSTRLKDLLMEQPNVYKTEHIYTQNLKDLSPKNQVLMRAYMQQAREQQALRRAEKRGDRVLYPRIPRGGISPQSFLR